MKRILKIVCLVLLCMLQSNTFAQRSVIFCRKNNHDKVFIFPLSQYDVVVKPKHESSIHAYILDYNDSTFTIKPLAKGIKAQQTIKKEISRMINDSIITTIEQIDSVALRLRILPQKQLKLNEIEYIRISNSDRSEKKSINKTLGRIFAATLIALPLSIYLTNIKYPALYASIGGLVVIESIVFILESNKKINLKNKWTVKQKI